MARREDTKLWEGVLLSGVRQLQGMAEEVGWEAIVWRAQHDLPGGSRFWAHPSVTDCVRQKLERQKAEHVRLSPSLPPASNLPTSFSSLDEDVSRSDDSWPRSSPCSPRPCLGTSLPPEPQAPGVAVQNASPQSLPLCVVARALER